MNAATQHTAMLAKYAGISFIAGSVNHGMFSGERALVTALLGVAFYILGGFLEMRAQPKEAKNWGDLLGVGILASVGLGFFTGGLQHFPDSPARSAWVVPLGFLLTLAALYCTQARPWVGRKAFVVYGLLSSAVVGLACVLAWQWLPPAAGGHDHHDGQHGHAVVAETAAAHSHAAAPPATQPQPAGKEVLVVMDDSMRYVPEHWQFTQGERVTFKLVNRGQVRHEFIFGSKAELAAHAKAMRQGPMAGHQHHGDRAISVEPGQSAELTWTFADAGTLEVGCLEPGHYEAGMKGMILVLPAAGKAL